jgi:protoporphyrinogen oxidase
LQGKTVAVVGAGLAGLRAAWGLQAAGARVVVVEARDQVGGKAALEVVDGFSIDRALQLLSFEDAGVLRWVFELGLGGTLLPLRPAVSAQLDRGGVVASDARNLGEIARTPGVTWRDRARLLRLPRLMRRYAPLLDPARPELAEALDDRSVADFARLYLGNSAFERFVAPRVAAATLGDEHELSRVSFLLQWQQSRCGAARMGIAAAGLGELAEAAASQLDVRTQLHARQLKDQSAGRVVLECSGRDRQGRDEAFDVDALVLTTPPAEALRIAASLITPAERDFLAGVRFGPRITLSVASDRPLTGLPQLVRVPHAEHRSVEVMLIEPGVPGARAPEGTGLVTLSATQRFAEHHTQEADEWVERALLVDLEAIQPSVAKPLRFTRLHRDPIGVPRFEVGAYRELARFQRVQQDRRALGRRLYFAGDYLAGPRFEDAVACGARATAAVVSDLTS